MKKRVEAHQPQTYNRRSARSVALAEPPGRTTFHSARVRGDPFESRSRPPRNARPRSAPHLTGHCVYVKRSSEVYRPGSPRPYLDLLSSHLTPFLAHTRHWTSDAYA